MISGERAKWRDVRLVPQVFNKGIKYIIIKKWERKNSWTILYRGSTGVTHWGVKRGGSGGQKGWRLPSASQCATLYDPPLFEKKEVKRGGAPFEPWRHPGDTRYKMVGQPFVNSIWQFWPLCSIPHFISIWNKTFSPISQGIPLKYPWSNTFGERKNIHIWLGCYLYWLRCREKYEAEYKNLSG